MYNVLFFLQLPPPVHGASVCNSIVVNSEEVKMSVEINILPIKFSSSISDMQKTGISKFLKIFPMAYKLICHLIFKRPRLVYFTLSPVGSAFYRDLLFVAIIKIFRVKILYHLHGKGIKKKTTALHQILYRFAFSNSSIICLSSALTGDIDEVKSNADIYICANGVDSMTVSPTNNEKIEVLFLSNLLPDKGIYEYFNVVNRLISSGVLVNVNLAGPFNSKFSESDLEELLIEMPKVATSFNYHGSVTGVQKWELLNKADILIHPTKNDAFPLVIIEAMASKCAIVSTDQGGIPDIINSDFGYVCPTGDSEALYSAIFYLATDKTKLNLYQDNAYLEYKLNYTVTMFEKNISNIINRIVER